MLGRDFEDEVWSRSVFELVSKPIGYFGKMNSTLGFVVPLAMFKIIFPFKDVSTLNCNVNARISKAPVPPTLPQIVRVIWHSNFECKKIWLKSELSKTFTIMKYFEGSFVNNFCQSKFGMKLIWIEVCSARKIRFCKNLETQLNLTN